MKPKKEQPKIHTFDKKNIKIQQSLSIHPRELEKQNKTKQNEEKYNVKNTKDRNDKEP